MKKEEKEMKDAIDILLESAGLSRVASQLKNLVLPSIRLVRRATQEELLPFGASKLGGAPDLPPDVAWPTWKGSPLAFVAQINLMEVPVLHEKASLPTAGILSFFYDADQAAVGFDPASRGGWRVLYNKGEISHLQRRPLPTSLLGMESPMQHGSFPACALTFSVEITYPPVISEGVRRLRLSREENDAYWDFLAPLHPDEKNPRHRLLGHPDAIQGDMQVESQLVSHGIYLGDELPPEREAKVAELRSGAQDWQLLLQLETDAEAGMEWGIEGRCYYWIQTEALQKHRFENVWSFIQWP